VHDWDLNLGPRNLEPSSLAAEVTVRVFSLSSYSILEITLVSWSYPGVDSLEADELKYLNESEHWQTHSNARNDALIDVWIISLALVNMD